MGKHRNYFFCVYELLEYYFGRWEVIQRYSHGYTSIYPLLTCLIAPARYMIWFVFSFSLLAGAIILIYGTNLRRKHFTGYGWGTAGGFAIGLGALYMLFYGDSIKPTFIRAYI